MAEEQQNVSLGMLAEHERAFRKKREEREERDVRKLAHKIVDSSAFSESFKTLRRKNKNHSGIILTETEMAEISFVFASKYV